MTTDPSRIQRQATQPDASVWVGASAGTGKTKVLTDRVLRLLLPQQNSEGTRPERVLCLTYTKAAASEMGLRIARTLSRWATATHEDLADALYQLLGRPALSDEEDAARRLFARVIDTPGGLKIMTIHAFCGSVLGRFPLEAGLPPHFTQLQDGEAASLLAQARDEVLLRVQAQPETSEGRALNDLAAEQNDEQFSALLRGLTSERHQLKALLKKYESAEKFYESLCACLGTGPQETEESVRLAGCADSGFASASLWECCTLLATGGKKDSERGLAMQAWLELDVHDRAARLDDWTCAFLTQKGEPLKNPLSKKLAEARPDLDQVMRAEAERLILLSGRIKACRAARLTRHLVLLGHAIAQTYEALKERRAALDFDDLIHRTRDLLRQPGIAGWVLYKLDGGLDHILIDEAQDTNPEQWDIVRALTGDFFAGESARGLARTLFVVGDEKQSIYSFQRAAPEQFAAQRDFYRAAVKGAGLGWADVALNVSFRSVSPVLRFVDAVFAEDAARKGLGDTQIRHESFREGHAGLVEIWPLFRVAAPEGREAWTPAVSVQTSRKAMVLLADHIAATVAEWFVRGERLHSQDRPVQAGDILVLVRRRSAFVAHLIRAFKKYKVPVSGIDRMVLSAQLAVQDLIALAQTALLPEDDLTLACVLKSPFIGYDDAMLEKLAFSREKGETLWSALRRSDDRGTLRWLDDRIARAGIDRPYEFFSAALNAPCPGDTVSGLHAISARLGDEALDPLSELLNQALAYEGRGTASLQLFLLDHHASETEIKREQEEAGGKVRIMTVHASKGLQAPIVFLPDTVLSGSPEKSDKRLIWPDKSGLGVPLWSPRQADAPPAFSVAMARVRSREEEEYRRLLYVAMTRAEDRLYISGWEGRNRAREGSWYHLMRRAFGRLDDASAEEFSGPDGLETEEEPHIMLRLENAQGAAVKAKPVPAAISETVDMAFYPWALGPPAEEPDPPRPLTPSRPSGTAPAARSPLGEGADAYHFRRGLVTHRLLQILPDMDRSLWGEAARGFAAQAVHGLPASVQDDIVRETLAVLDHPDYAPLFGPGSQAEVPLTGFAGGRLVSGQIDRLYVTEDSVWIVDYKTNRPPPDTADGIPDSYRNQLKAYKTVLSAIYPALKVRTFLLWTDGARLMELALD